MQLKTINQQVVVVFGASSGIGRETARRFAARGAKVVVAARGKEGLDSLVQEIQRDGGEATAIVADTVDFEQVKGVAEQTVERYGHLDTWVHCAAVSVYATFEHTTPEEFQRIIEVNLVGQAYGAMAALPYLKREGRGALIHISSVEAEMSLPFQSAYAASKHGIKGFLDALRIELQHEGVPISVTNIMPSTINTPFYDNARTKLGVKPIGYPPVYEPEIVADAILHAAEHSTREMVVGGFGKVTLLVRRFVPEVVDQILAWTGFTLQKTNERKSEEAPDNLYAPIARYDHVEGSFEGPTVPGSPYTWLTTHTTIRRLFTGTAVAAAGLWAARRFVSNGR